MVERIAGALGGFPSAETSSFISYSYAAADERVTKFRFVLRSLLALGIASEPGTFSSTKRTYAPAGAGSAQGGILFEANMARKRETAMPHDQIDSRPSKNYKPMLLLLTHSLYRARLQVVNAAVLWWTSSTQQCAGAMDVTT